MFANFYVIVLTIHGYWRWVVLLAAVASVVISSAGVIYRWSFKPLGRGASIFYVAAIDTQLFIGLCLYAMSPIVRSAWTNLSVAMKTHDLRFFSVEHITAMLLAVAFAHVGAFRGKRAPNARAKFLHTTVWSAASLAMILVGIPWWRPLFR